MRLLLYKPHGIAVFGCVINQKRSKLGIFIGKDVVESLTVFFLQNVYRTVV